MAAESTRRKPAIKLTRSDHARLWHLAESSLVRDPDVADALLAELERAWVVEDDQIGANVIRMGSSLRFTTTSGEDRTVMLVFPAEADIAQGKVSILTPVGAALIGLSAGQSIDWTARDGRIHQLTVEVVGAPRSISPTEKPKLQPAL
jgi:regulator of nucleoside diphosphate kinase